MAIGGSHKSSNFPYINMAESSTEASMTQGGIVIAGVTGASTLLLGDAVFFAATAIWNKSVTVANYQAGLGIVVGGRATDMRVVQDDALVGTAVSTTGQEVLIGIYGMFKSLADVALATIGVRVTGGAVVAGRVSTTGIAAGNHIGVTVTAQAVVGSPLLVWVGGGF